MNSRIDLDPTAAVFLASPGGLPSGFLGDGCVGEVVSPCRCLFGVPFPFSLLGEGGGVVLVP
jgi:hypothetical protein